MGRCPRESGFAAGRKVGASCLAHRFTDEEHHLAFLLVPCDCYGDFGVSPQLPGDLSQLWGSTVSLGGEVPVTELFWRYSSGGLCSPDVGP